LTNPSTMSLQIGCGRQLRWTSQSPDSASMSKACSTSVSVASESKDVREKRLPSSEEETEMSESSLSSGASSAPRTERCSFRSRSRGKGNECNGGAWTHAGGSSGGSCCCRGSRLEMHCRFRSRNLATSSRSSATLEGS
jgi:hypothetical protein